MWKLIKRKLEEIKKKRQIKQKQKFMELCDEYFNNVGFYDQMRNELDIRMQKYINEQVNKYRDRVLNLQSSYDELKYNLNKVTPVAYETSDKVNTLENIVEKLPVELFNDKKFSKHINDIIEHNVNNDRWQFEKKIQMTKMRSSMDINKVMETFKILVDGILDNYILKKYVVPDSNTGAFKPVIVTTEDRINDMNTIYDNIIVIVNTNFIQEQLGAFFDIYNINTKEFFIVQFIEPLYTAKINYVISKYEESMGDLQKQYTTNTIYQRTVEMENGISTTELENRINELYENINK